MQPGESRSRWKNRLDRQRLQPWRAASGLAGSDAKAAAIAVATRPVRHRSNPGVMASLFFRVAEIEDRGALRPFARGSVIGAEQLVPGIIGDAVIALLVMKVMLQM